MNPSDTAITRLLSEIRDLYGTLCAMTRGFMDAFSIPALNTLLADRSVVLASISSKERRLRRISEPVTWNGYHEYAEIKEAVASIIEYDCLIAERVHHDMKTVKRELSSLSATANAARIYTRNIRG